MKFKRVISALLVFCMLLTMFSTNFNYALAAEDTGMADMDALAALGIDTSTPPEGFDENNTSNPYGKDTVTVNPVKELYVLGLNEKTSILSSKEAAKDGDPVDKTVTKNINNSLVGTVYGHDNNTGKTTQDIMNTKNAMNIASGTTYASGLYKFLGGATNKGYYLQTDNYSISTNVGSPSTNDFSIASSKVSGGNFDGNKKGKALQNVLLYTGKNSQDGGLYMRIGDTYTGNDEAGKYGSAVQLIPTTKKIGNPSELVTDVKENFATDPYLMQNYLQVSTGDYDGDGIDEIAVFIPELNNSRIVVYKLKTTSGQSSTKYKDAGEWDVAWTYSLRESSYVSNMVSLVSGDFNEDGITDLGAAWGYYYGPDNNKGSKAVVMFGSRGRMLQNSQEFVLTFNHPKYGQSGIVRASFTFGDLVGSGSNLLVLGGQSDADLKNDNMNSRYVAIYDWNGSSFVPSISQNFDLFAKDDEKLVNGGMAINTNEKFYSSPLCPANLAVIKQGLSETPYLYLDSLQIKYGDKGLEIIAPLDQHGPNEGNNSYYVEYGAVSGDMAGLGYDTLVTMQQTMSTVETVGSSTGTSTWYYKNWFYKLLGIRTYVHTVTTETCPKFVSGKTYMNVMDFKGAYKDKKEVDTSTSICMQNTDDDTSYMQYTGKHYFTYSDPKILAVLASPPYFSDLLDRDDLSGNYAESTTSYSSTTGEGGGDTFNTTIEVGAYVSFEQEFSVFGVVVASAEAEVAIAAGFTYETEKTSTLEQTVSYSATSGEDMVAFYSIPLEIYEYTAYTSNGDGTYTKQAMTVNIPRTAAVQLLTLDYYESIAKDYDILPQISGEILTHTLGEPGSYASSESGYVKPLVYSGDWARVGYSGAGGGASISQEIAMTNDETKSYTIYGKIDTKAGAGAGGVTVGVTVGAEIGGGWVNTTTSGNSFSGDIQNMPAEAEEYAYSHSWKIFSYLYDDGKANFPVVNYLVKDVVAPPSLPNDFKQNVAKTTDKEIALTWTYDKMVAGFQIYRYYEFPDGTGSYELKFVPMTDGIYNAVDELFQFEYIDKNLSPYTDYQYQIQTVRASVPNNSIPSQVLQVRTKTDVGYPGYTMEGLDDDGYLRIYPDSDSTIKVIVDNTQDYPAGISYQWQKYVNGIWTNINGRTTNQLRFSSSGLADQASYRCRTNVMYFDDGRGDEYYISSYSPEFSTLYSKRIPVIVPDSYKATIFETDSGGDGLRLNLDLVSGNTNHFQAPTGNVTFTVKGTDYNADYTVELKKSSAPLSEGTYKGKYTSNATKDILNLPDGVYEISAYYGGSRVFKSLTTIENITKLIGESGYQLLLKKDTEQTVSFNYGDYISPEVRKVEKTSSTTTSSGITYHLDNEDDELVLEGGKFKTPNVGSYTLKSKHNGIVLVEKGFTVSQKNITIKAEDKDNVGKGYVSVNPPTLKLISSTMVFDEKLEDLKLGITARNSAGNIITLDNSTDPGNYTIIGNTTLETISGVYNNYNVTFVPGIYTIIGQKYDVEIKANPYQGRDVGTITLANSLDGKGAEFSAGTELMFYATPYAGYEVDSWSIVVTGTGTVIPIELSQLNASKTRLSYTMKSEPISVRVMFKKSETRLVTAKIGDGTITWDDPAFTDGAIVSNGAEINFKAIPEAGYTFKEWRIEQGGVINVRAGNTNSDGSNTLNFTMGNLYTIVRAVFERDSYTITMSDNLEAVYKFFDDYEGKDVDRVVYSGATIVGDTPVTVRIKAGYSAADDSVWKVNGVETDVPTGEYSFVISNNTKVTVDTVQQSYTINTEAENGTLTVKIGNDEPMVSDEEIKDVPGGSKVVFTAVPAHGYAFDSFVIVGTDKYTISNNVLTINELGANITITAEFTKSTDYTIDVNYGSRATINYVLYDPLGNEVKRDVVNTGGNIEASHGDKVTLIITPDAGFMVDKWTVNDIVYDTNSKAYDLVNISKNMTVSVDIISQVSYTVNYQAESGGSITSATSDGREFENGDIDVGGSSKVLIKSAPETYMMVDYWTFNGEEIKTEDGYPFVGRTLTIENLSSNKSTVDIKVYFTEHVEYAVEYNESNVDIDGEFTPDDTLAPGNIREGAKAIFTVRPDNGYRIVSAEINVENFETVKNSGEPDDEYGSWKLTLNEVNSNLVVTASAMKIHSININDVSGGEFLSTTETTYPEQAIAGEKVIIQPYADLDSTFVEWDVYDEDDKPIDVSYIGGEFSFIMPEGDVTITGEFKDISTVDIDIEVYDINSEAEGGFNGAFSAEIQREGISGYPKVFASSTTSGAITDVNRGYTDEYVSWQASRLKINAEPDTDYRVLKWKVNGVTYTSPLDFPVPSDSMNEFLMDIIDAKDINIVIQFEQIGEAITFGVDGGNGKIISAINEGTGNEFISGNSVTETTLTFEAKANSGYEVEAWLVNGDVVKSGNFTSFEYEADGIHGADIKVRFARVPFTVTYSGVHGKATSEQVKSGSTVRGDTQVTFTAEANPGYKFEKFNITGNTTTASTSNPMTIKITANTSVTANFVPYANCVINYGVVGANGTLTAAKGAAAFASGSLGAGNDVIVLTAHPNANYTVKEWLVDGKKVNASPAYALEVSKLTHSVSVEFERSHYVINFSQSGSGAIKGFSGTEAIQSGASLKKGSSAVFTALANSGFQVQTWKLNGNDIAGTEEKTTYTLKNIAADAAVSVVFEPIPEYIVTIVKTGTGTGTLKAFVNGVERTITNNSISVKNHDKVELVAYPKDEYNNVSWSLSGVSYNIDGNKITLNDVTKNAVATAKFGVEELITVEAYVRSENEEPAKGKMIVKAGYGDKLETLNAVGTTVNVTKGKTVQFTAIPDKGYKVKKWVINGLVIKDLNNTITRLPQTNIKAEVYFEPGVHYNDPVVTIKAGQNGKITASYSYVDDFTQVETVTVNSGDSVPAGVELTVSAVANSGYKLASWGDFAHGKSGSPIKLTVPNNDITLSATFVISSGGGGGDTGDGGGGGGGGGAPIAVLYTIKTTAGYGGSITPQTTTVEAGESQLFTLVPLEGFVISDVLVNGKSIGAVSTYTFSDVQKDSTIEAVFVQKIAPVAFIDVNDDDWFAKSVEFVVSLGLFKGTSEDTFSPYMSMTRGMFVTVLGRLYEYMNNTSLDVPEGMSFNDVSSEQYYAAAVKWASENNIITGYENGQFKPDEPISREQIVAIMYRFAVYAGLDTTNTSAINEFADGKDASPWAVDALSWAVGTNIMGGRTDGTLDPQGLVQRCEVAAILHRFIK